MVRVGSEKPSSRLNLLMDGARSRVLPVSKPSYEIINSRKQFQSKQFPPGSCTPSTTPNYSDEYHRKATFVAQTPLSNSGTTIMFFAYKNESFQLKKNYKKFSRILKSNISGSLIQLHDEISDGLLTFANLVILPAINLALSQYEVGLLIEYIESGGSVLVLGESTSIPEFCNAFTCHYGINLIKDTVIRVSRIKQYHPKQCYVSKCLICPNFFLTGSGDHDEEHGNLNILYPKGCSLELSNSAIPIMSSGISSYPCCRPIGAIYYNPESKGRIIVYGSGHSFTDEYIDLEDNQKLLELFLHVLLMDELPDLISRDMELKDHENFHCTDLKAPRCRAVLQDIDEYTFPGTINSTGTIQPLSLVSSKLAKLDFPNLIETFKAYNELKLDKIPLAQTVKPQFELGLPLVKLAVFPPTFRPLSPPCLELFDLDEEFSSVESRLGRIANKCSIDDTEYCVDAMGAVLDIKINEKFDENDESRAKRIVYEILTTLVNFKMDLTGSAYADSDSDSSLSRIDCKYFRNHEIEDEVSSPDEDMLAFKQTKL